MHVLEQEATLFWAWVGRCYRRVGTMMSRWPFSLILLAKLLSWEHDFSSEEIEVRQEREVFLGHRAAARVA